MKLAMALFMVFLFSCQVDWEDLYTMDHDVPGETREEFWEWMRANIVYLADEGDYWQLPHETYQLRTGDCEDQALLLMYLLWEQGEETELLIVEAESGTHAIVQHDLEWYEPGGARVIYRDQYSVKEVYTYVEAIGQAHVRGGEE